MYTVEMIKAAGEKAGIIPQELNGLFHQLKVMYGSEPQQNSGNTNVLRSLPCGDCENYAEYDGGLKYCSVCGTKL